MTSEELIKLIDCKNNDVICKRFCLLPNQVATDIESLAHGSQKYGYVLIGVAKEKNNYCLCGFDKNINMDNIVQSAIKQVGIKTDISYEVCNIDGKHICIIKVKTCEGVLDINDTDLCKAKEVLREVLAACVKLQANSFYYGATEDERNDYIRDILETAGYDIKDQTRRGLSPNGKAAGEVDILIKEKNFPVTIIEALNMNSLSTAYLDKHIDKIYDYDTAGNKFNIILSYVTVADFVTFCEKYFQHIKKHSYPFELISIDENVVIDNISYSNIRIMKTVHNRNRCETLLYHICMLIK
ncbi:MAG: hypothetical protein NC079_10865 [Clostridium sp.]|nr:hypothetical protein [Acetatifactor muris]MCM1525755.1 hypothetical protein [Bacteroides sp.]MCM1564091.1 hypothetical protein [Clostridium sp.]